MISRERCSLGSDFLLGQAVGKTEQLYEDRDGTATNTWRVYSIKVCRIYRFKQTHEMLLLKDTPPVSIMTPVNSAVLLL